MQWGPYTEMKTLKDGAPFVIERADGVYVYDEAGHRYLDAHAGLWLANVGYNERRIITAMHEQAQTLAWFPSFGGIANRVSLSLAERLYGLFHDDGMAASFFSNDGSEAVETALKIARLYWRAKEEPAKVKFIGRQHGYHGVTFGALSVAGITANRSQFEPLLAGVLHAPAPYESHCAFHDPGVCTYACVAEFERMIQFEGPQTIAAFIAEPVQAAGGVIIPPVDYLSRIRALCQRYNILFIADEVVTGFGRLGSWSGSRFYGIKPDMMTFAKGITSGYMPLGATMVSEEIFNTVVQAPSDDSPEFRHGNTYSGHPVAAAAALANIAVLEEDGLLERVPALGRHLKEGLERVVAKADGWLCHPGAVGLLGRVEIDAAKAGIQSGHAGLVIAGFMRERDVIIRVAGDVITFSPPLIVSLDEINIMMAALSDSVAALKKMSVSA